jgi:hypothetical protein
MRGMNSKSAELEVHGSIQPVEDNVEPIELTRSAAISCTKNLRAYLDRGLQMLKAQKDICKDVASGEFENKNEVLAHVTIAQRDLESSIMRLGMVLKNIGNPNPYPESYNPASSVVHPTADGLKL